MTATQQLMPAILAVVLFASTASVVFGNLTNSTLMSGVPSWAQSLFVLIASIGGVYFIGKAFGVKV